MDVLLSGLYVAEARRQSLAEEMPGDGLFRLADAELAMTLQHCRPAVAWVLACRQVRT